MKKKNPLYWKLESLPKELLKKRPLSMYRKDIDRTKRLKRGGVVGEVGHLPLNGKKEAWLPSVELVVLPAYALQPYGYEPDDLYDKVEEDPQLPALIRRLAGLTRTDGVVYLLSDPEVFDAFDHLYTPFMMLHDLGEVILGDAMRTTEYGSWGQRLKELLGKQQVHVKVHGTVRLNAYIPRLVHVQPHLPYKPQGGTGYQQQAATVFMDYILPVAGVNLNLVSDLWALWCKKERLVPRNFWPLKDTIDFFAKNYVSQPNAVAQMIRPPMPIKEYCAGLNTLFSELLESIKGKIILD